MDCARRRLTEALRKGAEDHYSHEGPRFCSQTQYKLGNTTSSKDSGEDDVASEIRVISIYGILHSTFLGNCCAAKDSRVRHDGQIWRWRG